MAGVKASVVVGAAHNRATNRDERQAWWLMEGEVICRAELQLAGQLASTRGQGPHYVSRRAKSLPAARSRRSWGTRTFGHFGATNFRSQANLKKSLPRRVQTACHPTDPQTPSTEIGDRCSPQLITTDLCA